MKTKFAAILWAVRWVVAFMFLAMVFPILLLATSCCSSAGLSLGRLLDEHLAPAVDVRASDSLAIPLEKSILVRTTTGQSLHGEYDGRPSGVLVLMVPERSWILPGPAQSPDTLRIGVEEIASIRAAGTAFRNAGLTLGLGLDVFIIASYLELVAGPPSWP